MFMRWDLRPLPPLGAATPSDHRAAAEEIPEDDPAVLADEKLIVAMSAVYASVPAEPFRPRPELLAAERAAIARHCRRAKLRRFFLRLFVWPLVRNA